MKTPLDYTENCNVLRLPSLKYFDMNVSHCVTHPTILALWDQPGNSPPRLIRGFTGRMYHKIRAMREPVFRISDTNGAAG